MSEHFYKIVKGSGATALATGIVTVVAGLVCGIMMIVSGARLLAAKAENLF